MLINQEMHNKILGIILTLLEQKERVDRKKNKNIIWCSYWTSIRKTVQYKIPKLFNYTSRLKSDKWEFTRFRWSGK